MTVVIASDHQSSAVDTCTDDHVVGGAAGSMTGSMQQRRLVVVGHRGSGKNKVPPASAAPDPRPSIRENTITSFNFAAKNGAQFVEFDVQVTKDGVPIIFHDDVIIAEAHRACPIRELSLQEFRAMGPSGPGPRPGSTQVGLALYRKAVDGSVALWTSDVEDCLCTLEEAFAQVEAAVGFNIELKFEADGSTTLEEVHRVVDAVVEVVRRFVNGRAIYFSSFHPDAVRFLRQKMTVYPVFFLTNGGGQLYNDPRRNSIAAAIQVCQEAKLQGIVSEVKPVLQNPAVVQLVKEHGLLFFTYGDLNNVAEAVVKQQSWGVDGVIVDHVRETVRVARQMGEGPASPSSSSIMGRRVSVALG